MSWSSIAINEQLNIRRFYMCMDANYESTFEFSGEAHNFWEMLYVFSGSLSVLADENLYEMNDGDIIFHRPLEFHRFHIKSREGVHLLIFSVDMDGPLTSFFQKKVFKLSQRQKHIINELMQYADLTMKQLSENGIETVNWNLLFPCKHVPTYSQLLSTYIYQLFLSLGEKAKVSEETVSTSSEQFAIAVQYMKSNISVPLSIDDIAKKCHLSRSGIQRLFLHYVGISPHKYFLTLKINQAKKMLIAGVSVNDISNLLGFSTQAYFSSSFKRETGTSPSEFRENQL